MNNSNWNYPTTVWFGEGRVKDLYLACKNLKIKKPLLVTDKDLGKSDLVKKITNDQNLKKLSINIFSNIKGNPVGSNVDEGVQVFKKGNPSTDIAFVEKTIGSFFCAYELDLFPLINCCNISLVYFKRFDMSVRFERVMSYSECVERFPSLSTYVTSLACDARINEATRITL